MPDFFKNFFKSSHGSSFRTDIAGIRGIAVMLVALAHFEIPGFGGGFIGPDIFFVLSGYLITGLLVKEYNKNISKRTGRGKISLGAFYLRRTRRILPASLFVLLCINIYARLNMNVLQVAQIKADSIWTVLFGANITFLRQATDYFAQNNAVSPLQHYWSLAVEEQFYFVWPVLFLTAASFHKLSFRGREFDWHQRLRAVFIALGIGSFAWMLVEFTTSPTTAYFSTFSRAWELALGGALSLLSVERIAVKLGRVWTILRAVALAAMVGSIAVVTPTNFGYTLVIPAVATGFLLISGTQSKGDPVYRLLSAKPLTALGAISFSMYLWHWPVFVFGRNLDLMNTLTQRLLGIVVCILLGTLSYWLIERTFLKIPLPTWKPRPNYNGRAGLATSRIFTSALTVLVVAGLGLVTYPSSSASEGTKVAAWVPPASAAVYAPEALSNVAVGTNNSPISSQVGEAWTKELRDAALHPPEQASPELLDNMRVASFRLPSTLTNQCPVINGRIHHCYFGSKSATIQWLVSGDSYAEMYASAFARIAKENPSIAVHLIYTEQCSNSWTVSGQRPSKILTDKSIGIACSQLHTMVQNLVTSNQIKKLIFSDSLDYLSPGRTVELYSAGFARYMKELQVDPRKVYVLGRFPKVKDLAQCANKNFTNLQKCSSPLALNAQVVSWQQRLAQANNVVYVDILKFLCFEGICPAQIANTPVGSQNHLNQDMAVLLAPQLLSKIQ